jgi:hypothetical protein
MDILLHGMNIGVTASASVINLELPLSEQSTGRKEYSLIVMGQADGKQQHMRQAL